MEIIHAHPLLDVFAVCSDNVFTACYDVELWYIRCIVVTVRPSFWSPHTRLCMDPIITSLSPFPPPPSSSSLLSLSPIIPCRCLHRLYYPFTRHSLRGRAT